MLGNPLLDRILMAINLLGILGGLGVFYYTEKIYKRPLPDNQAEFETLKTEIQVQTKVAPFPLEKRIINLVSANARLRFLEVEMHLMPYLQSHSTLLEEKKHLIYDSILAIVSKMTPHEINTVAGKILLEGRIRDQLNRLFRRKVVKKIYFTTFVVQ